MYHGMHDDGDYHGEGKFVTWDGTVYQGEWERGKRSGQANFFEPKSGVLTVGIWKDDVFVKYIAHKIITKGNGEGPGIGSQEALCEGFSWSSRQGGNSPHIDDRSNGDSHAHHHHHHGDGCNHAKEHDHGDGSDHGYHNDKLRGEDQRVEQKANESEE